MTVTRRKSRVVLISLAANSMSRKHKNNVKEIDDFSKMKPIISKPRCSDHFMNLLIWGYCGKCKVIWGLGSPEDDIRNTESMLKGI